MPNKFYTGSRLVYLTMAIVFGGLGLASMFLLYNFISLWGLCPTW